MNSERRKLKKAIHGFVTGVRDERLEGTLGRVNSDGSVTVEGSRQNYVIVRLPNGTYTELPNIGIGKVPLRPGLPVKMIRLHTGELVLAGENERLLGDDSNMPGSVYFVNNIPPDGTGNVTVPIPVKATGAEVDTGTDDAKFATPKAMEDSSYIKAAYADAKVADAINDGVTTIAPSQNAVFDALALKLPTSYLDTDATLAANSDSKIASQKATKSYVDAVAQGLSVKGSVRLATAAALPANTYLLGVITITATGVLTVDGVTVALNDRLLVKDEASQLKNGIYVCTTAGAVGVAAVLTRSADMDVSAEFPGAFVFVELGTTNATTGWVCTNSTPAAVGTTAITFTQFSGPVEIATVIHAATLDTVPLDADEVPSLDSSASFSLIRTTWTSIKAFLLTYFSTLFAVLAGTAGGQTLNGGTAANEDLILRGTAHATRASSYVALQDSGGLVVIGAASSTGDTELDVVPNGVNVPLRLRAGASGSAYIQFTPADASAEWGFLSALTGSLSFTHNTGPLIFQANGAERMRALAAGGVVIGGLTSMGASQLGIKAGTSSNDAAVGGVLYVDSGTHANGTTVETDLAMYTVPADTLAVNNQELYFEAWGTFAANSNTKTLKLKFGSDSFTLTVASSNNKVWRLRGRIIRTGAATQDVLYEFVDTAVTAQTFIITTATRTLSGANILKLTGQSAVAGGDVNQEYFKVSFEDANT